MGVTAVVTLVGLAGRLVFTGLCAAMGRNRTLGLFGGLLGALLLSPLVMFPLSFAFKYRNTPEKKYVAGHDEQGRPLLAPKDTEYYRMRDRRMRRGFFFWPLKVTGAGVKAAVFPVAALGRLVFPSWKSGEGSGGEVRSVDPEAGIVMKDGEVMTVKKEAAKSMSEGGEVKNEERFQGFDRFGESEYVLRAYVLSDGSLSVVCPRIEQLALACALERSGFDDYSLVSPVMEDALCSGKTDGFGVTGSVWARGGEAERCELLYDLSSGTVRFDTDIHPEERAAFVVLRSEAEMAAERLNALTSFPEGCQPEFADAFSLRTGRNSIELCYGGRCAASLSFNCIDGHIDRCITGNAQMISRMDGCGAPDMSDFSRIPARDAVARLCGIVVSDPNIERVNTAVLAYEETRMAGMDVEVEKNVSLSRGVSVS